MKPKYSKKAYETPDQTPVAVPLGFTRPPTLHETIQRILRSERFNASLQGEETFEESDDFDIPDDPIDPTTPWEVPADSHDNSSEGWSYDRDTGNLKKKVYVRNLKKIRRLRRRMNKRSALVRCIEGTLP